jgi:hypothetical protein
MNNAVTTVKCGFSQQRSDQLTSAKTAEMVSHVICKFRAIAREILELPWDRTGDLRVIRLRESRGSKAKWDEGCNILTLQSV